MKQKKLAPVVTLAIGLEMMLSPLAVHAREKENQNAGANEVFGTLMGVAGQVYSNISAQNQAPSLAMTQDMQAFKNQQTPLPDKYFSPQKLTQIPGLGQYLALNGINPNTLNCATLPTTLHEANNEVCRIGITQDKGSPMVQMQEAFAYMNQYTQIDKMYRNFTQESNVGGELFGVGCMKNALQVLNGFFQYRVNELDKMVTNIEALQNQFKEASRSDLDAIEEATAVLNGGGSELANKVKTRRPDLFDYGKRFNNPACTSMFAKEDFNKSGREKGLSGINQKLQDTISTAVGPMGFSGESYSRANADVISDINALADKAAKQMELGFSTIVDPKSGGYSGLISSMRGLSSANRLGGTLSPDLFGDVQMRFAEKSNKLETELDNVKSELGGNIGEAGNLVRNINSTSFESEVTSIEIRLKNACLSNSAQLDTVLNKMYDPTSSKFANKNASNFMKDKLRQIMENDRTTFKKKLSDLEKLEIQQGARYYVKMENSYEVQEVGSDGNLTSRVVPASTARTPSVFFSDIIKNCEAQFKVNNLGNKMSGATAIQKLRQLRQDYQTLAKANAQDVKDEIKKKLITCDNPTKANNSTPGSCKPTSFDTSSPGFCANAAFSCSKNMQDCTKQAEKFVTDIKQERTGRVNNYKNLVEKNKKDIIKIFDSALSQYMRDGELMRGTFGVGFTSPNGIQREVPESQRHLSLFKEATSGSVDGSLLLEDPEKFTAMFKNNIELLKKSVVEQQRQIVGEGTGGGGILAQHIKETERKYKAVAYDAAKFADTCRQKHDGYVAEMENQRKAQSAEIMKRQTEMGQKSSEFCRKYGLAQEHPGPACSGNISDLTAAVAAMPGGADAANEFDRVCASYNNESKGGSVVDQALSICPSSPSQAKAVNYVAADPAEIKKAEREHASAEREQKDAEDDMSEKKAVLNNAKDELKGYKKPTDGSSDLSDAKARAVADADAEFKAAKQNYQALTTKVEEAKDKLEEVKKDKPIVSEKPAKSESKAVAANGRLKLDSETIENCNLLLECQEEKETVDPSGKIRRTECSSKKIDSLAKKVVDATGGGELVVDGDLAPAFCAAGNGNMTTPKNIFDSMKQGFNNSFAGGAIGQ